MMKAVRVEDPGSFALVDTSIPTVGHSDVLIRVRAAGICGTDLHIVSGDYQAHYPVVIGHEFSGDVVEVGEHVKRFKAGDRVTADPNLPCNRCPACQRNEQNQCQDPAVVGVNRDGGFAQFVVVPESAVFSIGSLSYSAGALVEPLACVVWGLKRARITAGAKVLVQGAGPMGCLMLQAVRQAGAAFVAVTDTVPWRLELAARLGANTAIQPEELAAGSLNGLVPEGFDVVVDVTGIPSVVQASLAYVRTRGTLWLFGVCPPNATVSISPYEVFRKDLTIVGSYALSKTFPQSLALIQGGAIQVEPLVSHRFPLTGFGTALQVALQDPERMKVQVVSEP